MEVDNVKSNLLAGNYCLHFHFSLTKEEASTDMHCVQRKKAMLLGAAIALVFLGVALAGAAAYAHGGKKHGAGGEFTNLEALKKATELYDKLVAASKLDVDWETTVEHVQIAERRKGTEVEKVVSFSRSAGDPKTVYIFFKPSGEYAGSNFTGL